MLPTQRLSAADIVAFAVVSPRSHPAIATDRRPYKVSSKGGLGQTRAIFPKGLIQSKMVIGLEDTAAFDAYVAAQY